MLLSCYYLPGVSYFNHRSSTQPLTPMAYKKPRACIIHNEYSMYCCNTLGLGATKIQTDVSLSSCACTDAVDADAFETVTPTACLSNFTLCIESFQNHNSDRLFRNASHGVLNMVPWHCCSITFIKPFAEEYSDVSFWHYLMRVRNILQFTIRPTHCISILS